MSSLLLAIKPRFARAVLDNRKTVEFRRSAPRRSLSPRAVIYASGPVSAVVGFVTISGMREGTVGELLALAADDPMFPEYRAYLTGAKRPCAFELRDCFPLPYPIGLELLGLPKQPPQSWSYLPRNHPAFDYDGASHAS
jgi:predicted transcriptional regulator